MSDALIDIPDAMAGEYSGLTLVNQAPQAFVYRANDGLGEPVLITEIFHDSLCQRDVGGAVSAMPQAQSTWSSTLTDLQSKVASWSRLTHPALCGIDQVFSTNGTLYVVTRDDEGQPLDHLLPGMATNIDPRHLVTASEQLIDLQGYLHAFGITGLQIVPEALTLEDQEATISLSLQRLLDGTVSANESTSGTIADDCSVLARTLHCVLTGMPPGNPAKPLAGRLKTMPMAFLSTLDGVLSSGEVPKDFTARKWKAKAREATKPRLRLPRWSPIAAGVVCLLVGLAGWYGLSQRTDPEVGSQTTRPEIAIPDAGPWQLELPLQIVRADIPENGFVLRLTNASPEFMALNPWVQNGLRVAELNGVAVTAPVDLRTLTVAADGAIDRAELISLSVSDPDLPLLRDVAAIPYLWREKTYGVVTLREQVASDGWQLQVTKIDKRATLPLRAGDVLIREQVTDVPLERFAGLDDLLRKLEGTINPSLALMIDRDPDARLVVGFAIERLLDSTAKGQDL